MWIQTRFSFSRRLLSCMSEKQKWAVVVFFCFYRYDRPRRPEWESDRVRGRFLTAPFLMWSLTLHWSVPTTKENTSASWRCSVVFLLDLEETWRFHCFVSVWGGWKRLEVKGKAGGCRCHGSRLQTLSDPTRLRAELQTGSEKTAMILSGADRLLDATGHRVSACVHVNRILLPGGQQNRKRFFYFLSYVLEWRRSLPRQVLSRTCFYTSRRGRKGGRPFRRTQSSTLMFPLSETLVWGSRPLQTPGGDD